MRQFGDWHTLTISTDDTESDSVNLGREYQYLNVVIPIVVSCTLVAEVAESLGGTYQNLGHNTRTPITTGSYSDTWELGGYQFIKIKSSETQTTSDKVFRVRGYKRG